MTVLSLSSSMWSNLVEELVMEVFSRLPDKELLGLRCVSKQYYSLISKSLCPRLAASAPISGFVFQYKIAPHMNRHTRISIDDEWDYSYVTPAGSFAPFRVNLIKSYLPLLPFKPKTKDFIGCFNGFLLERHRDSSVPNLQYFVCNPVTRQCVSIPVNSNQYLIDQEWSVGLAFDPLLDTQQEQHNFKVVQISRDNETKGYPFLLDIFSSADGNWKSYPVALEAKNPVFTKIVTHTVYANGMLYMLPLAGYLVCFDLLVIDNNSTNITSIKACAIELPNDGPVGLLASSKGCLYYACISRVELLVWTFQVSEADSPWMLKYSISYREFQPIDRIIAVDLSAEIIYVGWHYSVFSYDIIKKYKRKNKQ